MLKRLQSQIQKTEMALQNKKNQLFKIEDGAGKDELDKNLLLYWLDNLTESVEIINSEGYFIYVNDVLCKRLGYSKEELLKMKVSDIDLDKNIHHYWEESLSKIKSIGTVWFEGSHIRKDGTIYPVEVNCKYTEIEGSAYLLAVTKDISDRKARERKLIRSEALLNEIMNNSEEAIFLFDPESQKVIDCNITSLKMFNFVTKVELMDSVGIFSEKMDFIQNSFTKIQSEVISKGNFQAEARYIKSSGKSYWCYFSAIYLDIEDENSYFLIRVKDIDNKKKSEESIKRSEKRYKDLVSYNQTLICTHDVNGEILTINPACLKSLEYSKENELVGKNLMSLFNEANHPGYHAYLKEINEKGFSQGIMQVVNKYGKKMYWVYSNYKVDEHGFEPYIVGSAQDITERVVIEKELKKAKLIAENSLKAREIFMANISHEVRTPLHGIMGISNLLNKTELTDDQRKYLKIIKHSSENLLFIMNDILDIAKIESGKFEFEIIPFELYDTILNTIQDLNFKAEEKGVALNLSLPKIQIPPLLGDPYRLSQIITNLTNNAIKFTDKGKIDIKLEILHDINEILTIEIKVTDTGIGIPEAKLDYIFEEFTQADSSHTRLYGGTGLGLAICKKIIEYQKGSIYANSKQGEGSEFGFIIHLKKSKQNQKYEDECFEINYDYFKGLRVLLVEDNLINQLIASILLESKGFVMDVAEGGLKALELIEKNDYDLILLDIQMPDIDGVEVATKIRNHAYEPKSKTPIIALTANAMKGDKDKYLALGMNAFLSKPYSENELFQKIASILNGSSIDVQINENDNNSLQNNNSLEKLG